MSDEARKVNCISLLCALFYVNSFLQTFRLHSIGKIHFTNKMEVASANAIFSNTVYNFKANNRNIVKINNTVYFLLYVVY